MIFMSEPALKGVFLHGLDYKKGAGMQYSLDEQLTGDLWTDGQPLYQKTLQSSSRIIVNSGTWVSTGIPAPTGINAILDWLTYDTGYTSRGTIDNIDVTNGIIRTYSTAGCTFTQLILTYTKAGG
jgi:hypothetical protein